MTKKQKENVIEFITDRNIIAEGMGNRPADVAYLHGAIDALRTAGIYIFYDSNTKKWVIY